PAPPDTVTGAPPSARQTLLAPDSRRPTGLAAPPGAGPARDSRAVAPPGVAAVLALDVAAAGRAAAALPPGPGPDRPDGPREPRVGQRANPGRAAEAGDRSEQAVGPAVPAAGAGLPAQPTTADVAHLPRQPPPTALGGRPAHDPHGHLPHAV